MLYSFLISLVDQFSALNVFRYLTFRTGLSVVSSMTIVFIIGGPFIKFIQSRKITGPIRDDGPIGHIIKKVGTPTMGGLLILAGILFGTLLWADLSNAYVWVLLMVATSFGLLGAIDDYLKIKHRNSNGISSGKKIFFQTLLSIIAVLLLLKFGDSEHLRNLYFPFFKNLVLHLGLFFIPFAIFVIVGSSNAVNLTDGLDGLATVPVMLVALSFTFVDFVVEDNTIKKIKHNRKHELITKLKQFKTQIIKPVEKALIYFKGFGPTPQAALDAIAFDIGQESPGFRRSPDEITADSPYTAVMAGTEKKAALEAKKWVDANLSDGVKTYFSADMIYSTYKLSPRLSR